MVLFSLKVHGKWVIIFTVFREFSRSIVDAETPIFCESAVTGDDDDDEIAYFTVR